MLKFDNIVWMCITGGKDLYLTLRLDIKGVFGSDRKDRINLLPIIDHLSKHRAQGIIWPYGI